MQPDKPIDPIQDTRKLAVLVLALLRALVLPLVCVIRHSMGEQYLGLGWAAAGFVIAVCFYDAGGYLVPYQLFLGTAGLLYFYHKFKARGLAEHSHYDGIPHLWRVLAALPEGAVKGVVEPLAVAAAGYAAGSYLLCDALAAYLVASSLALVLLFINTSEQERIEIRNINDAMADQVRIARRLGRRGRFPN